MNPYDFARIDWARSPERRPPVWHHRLIGQQTQRLYSGQLEVDVYAETPLFIADPRSVSPDPQKPAQSMQNQHGEYIIPGSSLKGMLRCLVETLGNGCLTLFDGRYERSSVDYTRAAPEGFQHCDNNTKLCIACRIFGMLMEGTRGVFLGKVNIGDAIVDPGRVYLFNPIYTGVTDTPKPHHAAFYLDQARNHIAGRKYYFHHDPAKSPKTENRLLPIPNRPGVYRNKYIQPLDYDTRFHFRIDFTALEADEFGALLLAVALEEDMRHKIGYGKPLGLGSISLQPISLTLVDYATRYTQPGSERGKTVIQGDPMWQDVLYEQIDDFSQHHLVTIAMDDLRRIWRWPPDPDVDYYYPSKRDWFDTEDSIGKRIADTRNVP